MGKHSKPMTKKQKRNLRKWVKALEGGEYYQVKGSLFETNGYCCMGVACVTINRDWERLPQTLWDPMGHPDLSNTVTQCYDSEAVISETLLDQLFGLGEKTKLSWEAAHSKVEVELNDETYTPNPVGFADKLAILNDTKGYDFAQIARAIRRRANAVDPTWQEA